ncbi:unnamed protein product [Meganyctiphanes norvegica]|uniref:Uncharacterized protein n=1 Tax=Meganyctiphanes norvegica TaxID=48144 RepID=A0AAV2R7A5_MEGNR
MTELGVDAILVDNTRGSNNNGSSILFRSKTSTGYSFIMAKLGEGTISTNNSRRSNQRTLGTLLGDLTVGPDDTRWSFQDDIRSFSKAMLELDQSTISKNSTRLSNEMAFAAELNIFAALGDNARWSNKNNVFSLFTGELGVTSWVNNTGCSNKSSKKRR